MFVKALILLMPVCCTIASPVPNKKDQETDAKVLYDQRQEGEWNVRAHLDNFIIMIIPAQTAPSTSSPGLLDFLTKSFPKANYLKRNKHVKKTNPEMGEETMHFIESKTAPYHVDISKSRTDIMKPTEDAVLASSPSIAVVKPEAHSHSDLTRVARQYVLAIPENGNLDISGPVELKSILRKFKKSLKEKMKQDIKLSGAENEKCEPGMVRDSYGICKYFKF